MSMFEHVVVVSGGLDSTTLLYDVVRDSRPETVKAVSFNYGQRHWKELEYANRTCRKLGVDHSIIDISSITQFLAPSGSALVADTDVPEGHYGEESMKQTVVPNRNMIMASIAAGHAVALEAKALWMGVHAGDHFIYPDCRPRFFHALNAAVLIGNEGMGSMPVLEGGVELSQFIRTPYLNRTKEDIASLAIGLRVPFEDTWSCYKGGAIHCGKCGTCVERLEAINNAIERRGSTQVRDRTEYEDSEFWKEAIKRETV